MSKKKVVDVKVVEQELGNGIVDISVKPITEEEAEKVIEGIVSVAAEVAVASIDDSQAMTSLEKANNKSVAGKRKRSR